MESILRVSSNLAIVVSLDGFQPFSEFVIGNLYNNDLLDIWQSEKYSKLRNTISRGLMPICSKCILLYLNGR